MEGDVRLTFEREPRYDLGNGLGLSEDTTLLALEDGELLCMGRCSVREAYVGGVIRRVGYMGELRLARRAAGRVDVLRGGYEFFHHLQADRPADVYFSSIARDNLRARHLLERGLRRLPTYRFVGDYSTAVFSVGCVPSVKGGAGSPWRLSRATEVQREALLDLLDKDARTRDLAMPWTSARFDALTAHGLSLEKFHLLHHGQRLVAAAALWDQRAFRQTRVTGYSRRLGAARLLYNAIARVMRGPLLPPAGTRLAQAFVCPFAVSPDSSDAERRQSLQMLLGAVQHDARARGVALLCLAGASVEPLNRVLTPYPGPIGAWLASLRIRLYKTRLYQVDWAECDDRRPVQVGTAGRPVDPEVALL